MKSRHVCKPLWLCLHFYNWSIDTVISTETALNYYDPLVIAEKQRVAFMSAAAQAAGIEQGMRLTTAYALLPEVTVAERNPATEESNLEQLCQWGYQFTPTVSRYKQNCLLLEIGGSLVLFDGVKNLLNKIKKDLQSFGYAVDLGLGHAPIVAWLFAQSPDTDISIAFETNQPSDFYIEAAKTVALARLDIPQKQLQKLLDMGLRTIGDLLALPVSGLGKRFGQSLINLVEEIKGDGQSPRGDYSLPRSFIERLEFYNGVTCLDELQEPIQQLLAKFVRFLQYYCCHPSLFVWQFFYYKKPVDTIEVTLAASDHCLSHLLSLTQLKLDHCRFQAPIEAIQLSCDQFLPATQSSSELFPELSSPDDQLQNYRALLDKLNSRLGKDALYTIGVNDEHLPEYKQQVAYLSSSSIAAIRYSNTHIADDSRQEMQPIWLLEKPVPVSANRQGFYCQGKLTILYPLNRVDSHWWQQRQQRYYFVARHQSGSHYWVFQDLDTQQWFVQGLFG